MLSPNDVISLEERWRKWNQKKLLKQILTPMLFLLFIFSGWYSYNIYTKDNKNNYIIEPKKILEENNTQKITNESEMSLVEDKTEEKNQKSIIEQKPRPALRIQPVTSTSGNPEISLPKSETILLENKINSSEYSTKVDTSSVENVSNTIPKDVIQNNSVQSIDEKPTEEKKIHIEIKPSSADTTKYLKEKFDSTGNIVFALMVSEEYYHMEQYNDAIRWALTANELDPKNERSWILFAQSKAKLGHRKEAIMALEEFLKSNNSGKIESLLIKLKQGKF